MTRSWQDIAGSYKIYTRLITRSWQDHDKIMARSWQDHGKIMTRSWQDHGEILQDLTKILQELAGFKQD